MDKREQAVLQDVGEDLEAHERPGLRQDDELDETDTEQDGRINIEPDSAAF
ncbi:hypothetical protein [Paenibacillus oceani]|uniref:Uncharacterized protein n=1 Tax=Paenibacillus oceani TaxID=2772510 RepID=A0A927CD88_9BACL|nr:hypothetical protein [Paenibacillus oceani]MBD2863816.1 hypothetical protein [Paenibacillus oceani]